MIINKYVSIDVDLEDFDTSDLKNELIARGETFEDKETYSEIINKIFYAFYFGKDDEAVELTRRFVQDVTGRILAQ